MSEDLNKPLYSRIQEYIAELILSGKLTPESKIQSEREFSEDLGVSRMTVRKALTELVNEGLLERKHGSGTYVAKPKITYESLELMNYVQAMQRRNIATTTQLLEFSEMVASRRLAELLEIEIGDPIYRLVLLRFANRLLPKNGRLGSGKNLHPRPAHQCVWHQARAHLTDRGGGGGSRAGRAATSN
jgi:GntR family transcriptional regulator